MKRLLISLAVFFLVAGLALAQDSNPVNISITTVVESGCYLSITPTGVSWLGVPVPTSPAEIDAWVPHDGALLDYFVCYRLDEGHQLGVQVAVSALFERDGVPGIPPEIYYKHVWSGEIADARNFPSVQAGQETFYLSGDKCGSKEGQIEFWYKNMLITHACTITGTVTYTALDLM